MYASNPWQPAVLTSPNRLNVRNGSVAGSYPASPARSIHLGHRRPRGTRPEPHPRRPARPQAGTACRIAAPSPPPVTGTGPGPARWGVEGASRRCRVWRVRPLHRAAESRRWWWRAGRSPRRALLLRGAGNAGGDCPTIRQDREVGESEVDARPLPQQLVTET